MLLLLVGLALIALASSQRGSPFRCRDREPQCAEWAGRGECNNNFDFMLDKCPVSCDSCENAKLAPTPSSFYFDFACNGKLATAPSSFKGAPDDDMPGGCRFHCADKMSAEVCAAGAADDGCKRHAKGMRFGCAATCGVCSGIGMVASEPISPLPKCEKGDQDEGATCESWAKQGECVANYDYMKQSCPRACGVCADDGQVKVTMDEALRKPRPAGSGKKKKGKKKRKVRPADDVDEISLDPSAPEVNAAADAVPAEVAASAELADNGAKKKRGWGSGIKDALGKVPGFRNKENVIKEDGAKDEV